jgi:hypothetical protein
VKKQMPYVRSVSPKRPAKRCPNAGTENMPWHVRVVPAAPVPPAVPGAHRALHQIALPAGIKFIENNSGWFLFNYQFTLIEKRKNARFYIS